MRKCLVFTLMAVIALSFTPIGKACFTMADAYYCKFLSFDGGYCYVLQPPPLPPGCSFVSEGTYGDCSSGWKQFSTGSGIGGEVVLQMFTCWCR